MKYPITAATSNLRHPKPQYEFQETTMKKLLLATVAIMLAGPALAADLPRYSEPAQPVQQYIAPGFNWER